jgi:hypothetical protein
LIKTDLLTNGNKKALVVNGAKDGAEDLKLRTSKGEGDGLTRGDSLGRHLVRVLMK